MSKLYNTSSIIDVIGIVQISYDAFRYDYIKPLFSVHRVAAKKRQSLRVMELNEAYVRTELLQTDMLINNILI